MKNKKAQEEMVGFVLIIVLVAVVGVIFLGISLRTPDSPSSESHRIASFLSSTSKVTTECEIPILAIKNIGQLTVECVQGKTCRGDDDNPVKGIRACVVLKDTLEDILDASFTIEEGGFVIYYSLTIIDDFSNENVIEPLSKGNTGSCLGRKLRNNIPYTIGLSQGQVKMALEVCFDE